MIGLLSFVALAALSSSALGADAAFGGMLAKRWCAACHVVASDQQSGSTEAPPFSAIADKLGFNAEKLALFLLEPHPKMPNMSLSRTEAADLAAYIASQGE